MMNLVLGAGLTVLSAVSASTSPASWTCAYVAERLPLSLGLLGEDTLSAEETRAGRRRLSLSDAVLTRASSLSLTRALGGTRLVVVRCLDGQTLTTLEAQAFDPDRPIAGEIVRLARPRTEIAAAIDEIARRLRPVKGPDAPEAFRAPSRSALSRASLALVRESATERARGLCQALEDDPGAIDLRLSAVEALLTAREFETAIRLASEAAGAETPPPLVRALRFQAGAAQIEAGRYSEAGETLESLRKERETAAVLNNLGVARFRMRDALASSLFERAAVLPDHRQEDIAFNRSLALLFEGKADQALPPLDAALAKAPSDVRSRLLRVWALRLLNRESERGEEWQRLILLAPSFAGLGNPDLARRLERVLLSERTPTS
jgi:tetratricopeptide (TPR) repeat protein